MEENFLDTEKFEESPIKDESSHDSEFDFDFVEDTLKHIYSKSTVYKKLAKILAKFYKKPILIIIFSFLFGFLFFGILMLFVCLNIFKNIIIPIFLTTSISLFLCLLIFVSKVVIDLQNKESLMAKWERKNILKIFGLILTLMIVLIGVYLLMDFFEEIIKNYEGKKLKLNYDKNGDESGGDIDKKNIKDFLSELVINCFLLNNNDIKNDDFKVSNYIEDNSIITNILKKICYSSIPFLIFSFNKILKTIFIKVKYTFSSFLFFLSCFAFSILIMVMKNEYDINSKNILIDSFELSFIIVIFLGYLIWTLEHIWRIYKNPKDKNFSIDKYDIQQLIFIYIFDIINIVGTLIIFISILIGFINYYNNNETYNDLKFKIALIKIGYILCIISNSFYYGHQYLALIFRPIALHYAPVKLKKNYIRANKNLSAFILIS